MELRDALRTTASIREFSSRSVDDAVLFAVLDDARFAPSGGNRQAWRVIVVKDIAQRRAVAAAYLDAWHDYVGSLLAGVAPFSPIASEDDRRAACEQREAARMRSNPEGFAETLASVPVLLVVVADLGALAATDRDLDRYQLVGGASVYPFVWSVLLAAHERDLGGVLTTVAIKNEESLRQILRLPDDFAVATVMALGYPRQPITKLKRREVSEFTAVDGFDGTPFEAPTRR
ncbi:MAG: nitroreductase family protein [Acidimicrobiales bacterium]